MGPLGGARQDLDFGRAGSLHHKLGGTGVADYPWRKKIRIFVQDRKLNHRLYSLGLVQRSAPYL